MSLPKRRHSRTRGRKRRGADRLERPNLAFCRECGAPIEPHKACPQCGSWKGRRRVVKPRKKKAEGS